MKKYSKFIANHSKLILGICLLLLIPSIIGYVNTRINYDILVYLPDNVDTIKGEKILTEDFGLGAYAFVMVDSADTKRMLALEKEIREISGVNQVFSIADVIDTTIPINMLPSEVLEKVNQENETIIMVTFDGTTSEDKTVAAVEELRSCVKDATKVSSMTSMVIDTRDLSSKEIFAYVVIAVLFCLAILFFATDSYLIPLLLLGNIGVAILYNMGTNIFLGEISYITKAITAILQLGVTMDFSIFLYHKYMQAKKDNPNTPKKEAMAQAITQTFRSVLGSSLTTFAGFLALCTMDLTLGTDIGIVMAKGVICGLICVFTLFPSLLLFFDKWLEKTKHKNIFPEFKKVQTFCTKHYKGILMCFLILLIPAYIGNSKYEVYYKLDDSLPEDLAFNVANSKLAEKFNIISPEIILLNKDLNTNTINELTNELSKVDGIDLVLAPSTLMDKNMIDIMPDSLKDLLENDKYQLVILNSTYEVASKELGTQIEEVNDIVSKYDDSGIIAGEGPLMNDLVTIADHDFKTVNYTSILVIFIIMVLVLKQISLPVVLIFTIEFAIFTNMSVAYFTNTALPFIASIVVGTIQLGATIDYAILMSTKYLELRNTEDKKQAIEHTLKLTVPSIITSALCFFAATFGVAVYTKIDMIGSICELLARGSIISMLVVVTILPSLLMVFDKLIIKNKKKEGNNMKKGIKLATVLALSILLVQPLSALATEKKETVYSEFDYQGNILNTKVNNKLFVSSNDTVKDNTLLTNILNVSGDEEFTLDNQNLVWQGAGKDIFYQGSTDQALPISLVVKYYLDEEEVKDINDILGKSGHIKIEIKFLNNSLIRTDNVYIPYVITVGTIIDSDSNRNIKISNGKVIDTGSRSIAVSLAAPGLYESTNIKELKSLNKVMISYDTDEFSLNDIYMVSTPKLLAESDLKIFDKLDSLSSSINLLSESMDKLEQGSVELENGSLKLMEGSKTISDSLKTVSSATKKLQSGSITIDDGINQIIAGVDTALNTIDKNQIALLKVSNEQAITKLESSLSTLKDNYNENWVNLSNVNFVHYLEAQVDNSGNRLYDDNLINQLVNVKVLYENTFSENTSLLELLKGNYQVVLGMDELINNLETLSSSLKAIANGSSSISTNLSIVNKGLQGLYSGSIELNNGTVELNAGLKGLSDGITKLNEEGIDVLVDYSNTLNNYGLKFKKLVNLSKNYNGFATNNATDTTFVFKISSSI